MSFPTPEASSRAPTDPPDAAEIEVSTFGPGVGESIVPCTLAPARVDRDGLLPRPCLAALRRCLPRADRHGPGRVRARDHRKHWDSDHFAASETSWRRARS